MKFRKILAATSFGAMTAFLSAGPALAGNHQFQRICVPEIDATAGVGALAVLVCAVLIAREIYSRSFAKS